MYILLFVLLSSSVRHCHYNFIETHIIYNNKLLTTTSFYSYLHAKSIIHRDLKSNSKCHTPLGHAPLMRTHLPHT